MGYSQKPKEDQGKSNYLTVPVIETDENIENTHDTAPDKLRLSNQGDIELKVADK